MTYMPLELSHGKGCALGMPLLRASSWSSTTVPMLELIAFQSGAASVRFELLYLDACFHGVGISYAKPAMCTSLLDDH